MSYNHRILPLINLEQKVPEPTTHPTQRMPDLVPTSPFISPLYTTHANRVQLLIKFSHYQPEDGHE